MLAHAETCGNVVFAMFMAQFQTSSWTTQTAGKRLANGWQTDLIHLDFHNVRGPHQISERAGRSNFEVCFGALYYAALFCSWVQVCPCLSKCDSV